MNPTHHDVIFMLKSPFIRRIQLWIKWIVLILAVFSISACGKKTDRTQVVYETAYAILTQTADAAAKISTFLPQPTQLGTSTIRTTATFTPEINQQTSATPSPQIATPVSQPTIAPTSPSPPRITASTNTSNQNPGGGSTIPAFPTDTPEFTPTATTVPSSTPPIQPPSQGVVGIWQEDREGWTIQFNGDGTYILGPSFRYLTSDSVDQGQYNFQNDQVTLTGSATSSSCKSEVGIYQVQNQAANQRLFNLVQDKCYARQSILAKNNWYWLPVLPGATPAVTSALEQPLRIINLAGSAGDSDAHLTSLDWSGDNLVLLPQNPDFVGDGKSYLFSIPRFDIIDYLSDYFLPALEPQEIVLIDSDVVSQLPGFQGYQAMAISGDKIYLIAQAISAGITRSYLVAGTIAADLASITLDATQVVDIPVQSGSSISNYRSLIVTSDSLIALPDLNGSLVNTSPAAQRFSRNLVFLNSLPIMSNLDYVVTDATEPDSNGLFWVINKYAQGDLGGVVGLDPQAQLYGKGVTHQAFDYTERLIPYRLTANRIDLTANPPIQFELSASSPRNWQGLTALGDQGFLAVSDQGNSTILGYVDKP